MIVGIDFGTTKSVIAASRNSRVEVIPDNNGNLYMPSVVLVTPQKNLYVGREAVTHRDRYAGEYVTINSIKRKLGKVGKTDWGGYQTFPQEVAALILARLKRQAEEYLHETVDSAVVAIPAHFDINQRAAISDACNIAGIKVVRLINEATAVAFAYGVKHRGEGKILVFDLGGGTLDISLVDYGGGVYEVAFTQGDGILGGDDFTQALVEYLMERIRSSYGEVTLNPTQQALLQENATRAKEELSSATSTRIYIPSFFLKDNAWHELDIMVTRQQFERRCQPLFERIERILTEMQREQATVIKSIDVAILMGGSSRIPYISSLIQRTLGLKPYPGIDPLTSVAEGAASIGQILSGSRKDLCLLDITPNTYGVGTQNGAVKPIIPKGHAIPARASSEFTTVKDNQTEVDIRIYAGESAIASENQYLGTAKLAGLVPLPAGESKIQVIFDINADGILQVGAMEQFTSQRVQTTLEAPYTLNPAQIAVMRRQVAAVMEQPGAVSAGTPASNDSTYIARVLAGLERYIADNHFITDQERQLLADGVQVIQRYIALDANHEQLLTLVEAVNRTWQNITLNQFRTLACSIIDSDETAAIRVEIDHLAADYQPIIHFLQDIDTTYQAVGERLQTICSITDISVLNAALSELLNKFKNSEDALLFTLVLSRFSQLGLPFAYSLVVDAIQTNIVLALLVSELLQPDRCRQVEAARLYYTKVVHPNKDLILPIIEGQPDPEALGMLIQTLGQLPAGMLVAHYYMLDTDGRQQFIHNSKTFDYIVDDVTRLLASGDQNTIRNCIPLLQELGLDHFEDGIRQLIAGGVDEGNLKLIVGVIARQYKSSFLIALLLAFTQGSLAVKCQVLDVLAERQAEIALVLDSHADIKYQLTTSVANDALARGYLDLDAGQRTVLTRSPFIRDMVSQGINQLLCGSKADRLRALAALPELDIEQYADSLADLLSACSDQDILAAIIPLLATCFKPDMLGPLVTAFVPSAEPIRQDIVRILLANSDKLDPESVRFVRILARLVLDGNTLTAGDKLFIWQRRKSQPAACSAVDAAAAALKERYPA